MYLDALNGVRCKVDTVGLEMGHLLQHGEERIAHAATNLEHRHGILMKNENNEEFRIELNEKVDGLRFVVETNLSSAEIGFHLLKLLQQIMTIFEELVLVAIVESVPLLGSTVDVC